MSYYDFDCATGLTEEVANGAEAAEGDSAAGAAKSGKKKGNMNPLRSSVAYLDMQADKCVLALSIYCVYVH